MYKCLFLLTVFISATSFANNSDQLQLRCLPYGINLNKTSANLEFKTRFDISEKSFKHPETKQAVIFGMKWEDEEKMKKGIIDESKQCRIVADMAVFKNMEGEEIARGDRYHFAKFYPANTNGKHPFQVIFRNGGLDPGRIYIECDQLDENSTVAELEEAIEHVAEITIGAKADLSNCQ